MKLASPAFADGAPMPTWCGKKVDNISPPLHWNDAPAGTRSFALVMVDIHPVARGYVHWMISGLPAATRALDRGQAASLPPGTREHKPYAGPFPPSGTHSYEFRLFALTADVPAILPKATMDALMQEIKSTSLGSTVLTGTYAKV